MCKQPELNNAKNDATRLGREDAGDPLIDSQIRGFVDSLFLGSVFSLVALLMLSGLVSSNALAAQPQACKEIYTVQANDWLSKVSDKFLGNTDFYPAIIAATKGHLLAGMAG